MRDTLKHRVYWPYGCVGTQLESHVRRPVWSDVLWKEQDSLERTFDAPLLAIWGGNSVLAMWNRVLSLSCIYELVSTISTI